MGESHYSTQMFTFAAEKNNQIRAAGRAFSPKRGALRVSKRILVQLPYIDRLFVPGSGPGRKMKKEEYEDAEAGIRNGL